MTTDADDELQMLLDELAELTEDDAARRRAWQRAKSVIERRRLTDSLDRARHEVGRWAAAGRSDYHGIGGLMGMPADQARLRLRTAPAALDAAAAVLAGDELEPEDRAVLSRPWLAVDEIADEADDIASPSSG